MSSINCLRNLFFLFLVIIPSVEPQPLLLLATSGNLFFFFFLVIVAQNIRKVICALAATYIDHIIYTFPSKSPPGHFVWRILHNVHPAFSSGSLSPLLLLYFLYSIVVFYKLCTFLSKDNCKYAKLEYITLFKGVSVACITSIRDMQPVVIYFKMISGFFCAHCLIFFKDLYISVFDPNVTYCNSKAGTKIMSMDS